GAVPVRRLPRAGLSGRVLRRAGGHDAWAVGTGAGAGAADLGAGLSVLSGGCPGPVDQHLSVSDPALPRVCGADRWWLVACGRQGDPNVADRAADRGDRGAVPRLAGVVELGAVPPRGAARVRGWAADSKARTKIAGEPAKPAPKLLATLEDRLLLGQEGFDSGLVVGAGAGAVHQLGLVGE